MRKLSASAIGIGGLQKVLMAGAIFVGITATSCKQTETYDIVQREIRFPAALSKVNESKGEGPLKLPLPESWKGQKPVTLKLGLADCLDLASQHNRDLMLEQLSVELAKDSVLDEQSFTDIVLTGNAKIAREEQEVASRFVGDTRTLSKETTTTGDVGVRLPFYTGTTVNARHGLRRVTTNSPFNTFEWSSTFSISVTQNLLEGLGTDANRTDLDAAELELDATRGDADVQVNSIRYGIAESYWNLVLAREDLGVLTDQLETARIAVDRQKRMEAQGQRTNIDVLRAQSTLKARERDIIDAELAVAQTSDALLQSIHPDLLYGYLLKRAFKISVEPKDSLDTMATQDVPEIYDELRSAFEQRADLRAARLRLEASGLRVRRAEKNLLPNLDLTGDMTLSGFGDSYDETLNELAEFDSRTLSIGLSFEMPLQNRRDRAGKHRAEHQRLQSIENYRKTEAAVILEVVDAVRNIESRQKAMVAANEALALAIAERDAIRRRSDVGMSNSFEVKEAEDDAASAERDATRTRVNLQLARLELLRATGSFGR